MIHKIKLFFLVCYFRCFFIFSVGEPDPELTLKINRNKGFMMISPIRLREIMKFEKKSLKPLKTPTALKQLGFNLTDMKAQKRNDFGKLYWQFSFFFSLAYYFPLFFKIFKMLQKLALSSLNISLSTFLAKFQVHSEIKFCHSTLNISSFMMQ